MRTRIDQNLVRHGLQEIIGPEDLSSIVVVVIALIRMGVDDVEKLATLVGADSESLSLFVERLKNDPDPIIQSSWEDGFPPGVHGRLAPAKTIRCSECHVLIDTVPCVRCAAKGLSSIPWAFDPPTNGLPKRPTKARPGTAGKMRVLRARLARSEELFHPKDATL